MAPQTPPNKTEYHKWQDRLLEATNKVSEALLEQVHVREMLKDLEEDTDLLEYDILLRETAPPKRDRDPEDHYPYAIDGSNEDTRTKQAALYLHQLTQTEGAYADLFHQRKALRLKLAQARAAHKIAENRLATLHRLATIYAAELYSQGPEPDDAFWDRLTHALYQGVGKHRPIW